MSTEHTGPDCPFCPHGPTDPPPDLDLVDRYVKGSAIPLAVTHAENLAGRLRDCVEALAGALGHLVEGTDAPSARLVEEARELVKEFDAAPVSLVGLEDRAGRTGTGMIALSEKENT